MTVPPADRSTNHVDRNRGWGAPVASGRRSPLNPVRARRSCEVFQTMHSPTNVIKSPKRDRTDGDSPTFYAWRWARGVITITIMGLDDLTDGETMLTFSPEVGVELGQSKVLALSGEPMMLHFTGTFAEHRDTIFSEWDRLADNNDRPGIFDQNG